MNRVLVIGNGGAGKSTFSKRLSSAMGLPLVHLDTHYWRPGWIATPKQEWLQTVDRLLAGKQWVMDGNYGGTMRVRMAAADAIIYLDLPRMLCLLGVLSRRAFGNRVDEIPGCREKIDFEFLKWIWNYPKKNRPIIVGLLDEFRPRKAVYVLKSRRTMEEFIRKTQGQSVR